MKLVHASLVSLALLGAGASSALAAKPKPATPVVSLAAPAAVAADPANRLTLDLSTGGRVVIQLRPDVAPHHVYRIQTLAASGFYDGLVFHRVIPGFMAQGGDPKGNGTGGSRYPSLKAEFNALPHVRGVIAMARSNSPDSANSQFFLVLSPSFSLDKKYTVFGRVISGMAAVDGIAPGEPPANPTRIVKASIGGPLPPVPAGFEADMAVAAASPAPAPSGDSTAR